MLKLKDIISNYMINGYIMYTTKLTNIPVSGNNYTIWLNMTRVALMKHIIHQKVVYWRGQIA